MRPDQRTAPRLLPLSPDETGGGVARFVPRYLPERGEVLHRTTSEKEAGGHACAPLPPRHLVSGDARGLPKWQESWLLSASARHRTPAMCPARHAPPWPILRFEPQALQSSTLPNVQRAETSGSDLNKSASRAILRLAAQRPSTPIWTQLAVDEVVLQTDAA